MSFANQLPFAYAYPNLPPPPPSPGHFLIAGNPPYQAPQGHTWEATPPTATMPSAWKLVPGISVNERGEWVSARGEIFHPPMQSNGPPGMPECPPTASGAFLPADSPYMFGPAAPTTAPVPASPAPPTSQPNPSTSFQSTFPRPRSRQNSWDSAASTIVAASPTLRPTASASATPSIPAPTVSVPASAPPTLHFRHVRFLDGDTIVPAGVGTPPSPVLRGRSRERGRERERDRSGYESVYAPIEPRPNPLPGPSDPRASNTPATASQQSSGSAHTRPIPQLHRRRRTRSPSPYPTRSGEYIRAPAEFVQATGPSLGTIPPAIPMRSRTSRATDPSGSGHVYSTSEPAYPKWPACTLCDDKPATKTVEGMQCCEDCFVDCLRAELRRVGG